MANSVSHKKAGGARLWLSWALVVFVLLSIAGGILVSERWQRFEAAEQSLISRTDFLASVLESYLQNGSFDEARDRVTSWGRSQPHVLRVRLAADNGFVLSEFTRNAASDRRHERRVDIVFSYRGAATLVVEESMEPEYSALASLAKWLAAGTVVMALIAFLLLWNIEKYRRQVRLTWEEVDRRMEAQMALEQVTTQDKLTGLANRYAFNERLKQEVAESRQFQRRLALLVIDLDDFKDVNGSLGHEQGDSLLQTAASRMSLCLRSYDFLARFGGDAFVAILPSIESDAEVEALAQRVKAVLNKVVSLGPTQVVPSASIGISLYPQDGETADKLLRNADAAMHSAKRAGRNVHRFYTESLNAALAERNKIDVALHEALRQNQGLSLVYEPQVDIRTGEISSCEALLRWHWQGRDMPREAFLSVAEQSSVMVSLQGFVIKEVVRQHRLWETEGLAGYRVDINLAGDQAAVNEVMGQIEDLLDQNAGWAKRFGIEITERLLVSSDESLIGRLMAIRSRGVVVSLDDFGTGYSSLDQLKRMPVDVLKIDQSFIQGAPDSAIDAAIVRSVVSMGHSMNKQVLAEGVETHDQLEFVTSAGCDVVQGFMLHQPMTARQLTRLMMTDAKGARSGIGG